MKQTPITGGITAALDKARGVGNEDCGHDDWGYYPPLQEIYILLCRTCGTIKQCIPSEDEMEIVGARYLNPRHFMQLLEEANGHRQESQDHQDS